MNFTGSNTYLNTTDADFFYEHLDTVIKNDRDKCINPCRIMFYYTDNDTDIEFDTNVGELFLAWIPKLFDFLNGKRCTYEDDDLDHLEYSKHYPMHTSIIIGNIQYEKEIAFCSNHYKIHERVIWGNNRDMSLGEHGTMFYPAYEDKIGDFDDFEEIFTKEIEAIINNALKPLAELSFCGNTNGGEIDIKKTSDVDGFISQLDDYFDVYLNIHSYMEGLISIVNPNGKTYAIKITCDKFGPIITYEDNSDLSFGRPAIEGRLDYYGYKAKYCDNPPDDYYDDTFNFRFEAFRDNLIRGITIGLRRVCMDVRKTEAIMPEDNNRTTDNIKIGYRLKKTGSNKFRCWITYHSRRDMYLMDSEYWCTVFSREVLASESELNRLVSCGELTSIETRYIESSDQYNSTKKTVVDENGNQLNVDSRQWKYFDWTDADKECNTPVCMNDH